MNQIWRCGECQEVVSFDRSWNAALIRCPFCCEYFFTSVIPDVLGTYKPAVFLGYR